MIIIYSTKTIYTISNVITLGNISKIHWKWQWNFREMCSNAHAQRTNDSIATSLWRHNDVATSFWRHNDVIIALCASWVCFYPGSQYIATDVHDALCATFWLSKLWKKNTVYTPKVELYIKIQIVFIKSCCILFPAIKYLIELTSVESIVYWNTCDYTSMKYLEQQQTCQNFISEMLNDVGIQNQKCLI